MHGFEEAGSEYQIVLDPSVRDAKSGFLTGICLRIEALGTAASPDTAERLAHKIRTRLQVRALVDIVPHGTLPRSTHKSKRVVREGLDGRIPT